MGLGLEPAEFADYLAEIGGTLVAYGCPSYRLEDVIAVVAEDEGYTAQTFALPTGLFLTLSAPGQAPLVRMVRAKRWETNLDRLVLVDGIFNDVGDKKKTIAEARRELADLERRPFPYPRALIWVAAAAVSASAGVFLGGQALEVAVGGLGGFFVVLIGSLMSRSSRARFLIDFMGGLAAALLAWATSLVFPGASREVIVLAGIIALVPGMTLTTGLAELAQKNLVSGGARLMEAFATFMSILVGIAFAVGVEQLFFRHSIPGPVRPSLSLPFHALAAVTASLGIGVLFAVPRRYLASALVSGVIGYAATALGVRFLPAHVSAFLAALAVCLFANGLARLTQRPAQLFQLPGMLLLVPGSFGVRSLEDFLHGDFLNGAAKAFSMLLIAGALVTGVLLSNVVLPAKKLL